MPARPADLFAAKERKERREDVPSLWEVPGGRAYPRAAIVNDVMKTAREYARPPGRGFMAPMRAGWPCTSGRRRSTLGIRLFP